MTEEQLIAIYCFCDDFLKARGHRDWPTEIVLIQIMKKKKSLKD